MLVLLKGWSEQSDLFLTSADNPHAVFSRYEQLKRDYKNTARSCTDAGFLFVPFVIEAHAGSWSPSARSYVDFLANQSAAAQHEEPATVSLRIAQRISSTLLRESARAVLRRLPSAGELQVLPSGWDATEELDMVSLVAAPPGSTMAATDIRLHRRS